MSSTILLGYDPMGELLAQSVIDAAKEFGAVLEVWEGSGANDYPDTALAVCRRVLAEELHSGILICGTGLGMSISANKVTGIRAARCTDIYSVEKARRNSNANVLAMGSEVTTPQLCRLLMEGWLRYDFDSQRSVAKLRRVAEIEELERVHV
jgi:ribose 5-phosphate isomerase B